MNAVPEGSEPHLQPDQSKRSSRASRGRRAEPKEHRDSTATPNEARKQASERQVSVSADSQATVTVPGDSSRKQDRRKSRASRPGSGQQRPATSPAPSEAASQPDASSTSPPPALPSKPKSRKSHRKKQASMAQGDSVQDAQQRQQRQEDLHAEEAEDAEGNEDDGLPADPWTHTAAAGTNGFAALADGYATLAGNTSAAAGRSLAHETASAASSAVSDQFTSWSQPPKRGSSGQQSASQRHGTAKFSQEASVTGPASDRALQRNGQPPASATVSRMRRLDCAYCHEDHLVDDCPPLQGVRSDDYKKLRRCLLHGHLEEAKGILQSLGLPGPFETASQEPPGLPPVHQSEKGWRAPANASGSRRAIQLTEADVSYLRNRCLHCTAEDHQFTHCPLLQHLPPTERNQKLARYREMRQQLAGRIFNCHHCDQSGHRVADCPGLRDLDDKTHGNVVFYYSKGNPFEARQVLANARRASKANGSIGVRPSPQLQAAPAEVPPPHAPAPSTTAPSDPPAAPSQSKPAFSWADRLKATQAKASPKPVPQDPPDAHEWKSDSPPASPTAAPPQRPPSVLGPAAANAGPSRTTSANPLWPSEDTASEGGGDAGEGLLQPQPHKWAAQPARPEPQRPSAWDHALLGRADGPAPDASPSDIIVAEPSRRPAPISKPSTSAPAPLPREGSVPREIPIPRPLPHPQRPAHSPPMHSSSSVPAPHPPPAQPPWPIALPEQPAGPLGKPHHPSLPPQPLQRQGSSPAAPSTPLAAWHPPPRQLQAGTALAQQPPPLPGPPHASASPPRQQPAQIPAADHRHQAAPPQKQRAHAHHMQQGPSEPGLEEPAAGSAPVPLLAPSAAPSARPSAPPGWGAPGRPPQAPLTSQPPPGWGSRAPAPPIPHQQQPPGLLPQAGERASSAPPPPARSTLDAAVPGTLHAGVATGVPTFVDDKNAPALAGVPALRMGAENRLVQGVPADVQVGYPAASLPESWQEAREAHAAGRPNAWHAHSAGMSLRAPAESGAFPDQHQYSTPPSRPVPMPSYAAAARPQPAQHRQVDLQPPAADALAAPEASADDLSPWFHELGLRDPAKSHPLAEEALSDEDSGLPDQLDVPVHAAEVHAIPQVAESQGVMDWSSVLSRSAAQQQEAAAAAAAAEQQQEDADLQAAIQASLSQTGRPSRESLEAGNGPSPIIGDAAGAVTGLQNHLGEYNCFLNVILQCLWHCCHFQQRFMDQDPACLEADPIVAALLHLFQALAEHNASADSLDRPVGTASKQRRVVDPSELREALARLDGGRPFQLGEMNDAAEVLTALYDALGRVGGGAALVDSTFGVRVNECVYCEPCRRSSHTATYTQHFFNASATALRMQLMLAQMDAPSLEEHLPPSLAMLLKLTEQQHQKTCDRDAGGCGQLCSLQHMLVGQPPHVFVLQLAWEKQQERVEDINSTMSCIQEELDLAEVYQGVAASEGRYRLRSMVGFYGSHYFALVRDDRLDQWLMLDDALVSTVGHWGKVLQKCQLGHIQPSVLLFERV